MNKEKDINANDVDKITPSSFSELLAIWLSKMNHKYLLALSIYVIPTILFSYSAGILLYPEIAKETSFLVFMLNSFCVYEMFVISIILDLYITLLPASLIITIQLFSFTDDKYYANKIIYNIRENLDDGKSDLERMRKKLNEVKINFYKHKEELEIKRYNNKDKELEILNEKFNESEKNISDLEKEVQEGYCFAENLEKEADLNLNVLTDNIYKRINGYILHIIYSITVVHHVLMLLNTFELKSILRSSFRPSIDFGVFQMPFPMDVCYSFVLLVLLPLLLYYNYDAPRLKRFSAQTNEK